MFGWFSRKEKKDAKNLLSAAYKVYNYRRDLMPEGDALRMEKLMDEIEELILDDKLSSDDYSKASSELEKLMKKNGGKIYPFSSMADNVETIVVVGIIAISVRSFFFQPFKIPTNSMYPTFYGMTPKVYKAGEDSPGAAGKIWRFITLGAWNYSADAANDGTLFVEINPPDSPKRNGGLFASEILREKKFGFWPSVEREYTFFVGDGLPKKISVPSDFNLDAVIMESYPLGDASGNYVNEASKRGLIFSKNGKYFMKLADLKKGDRIINFDILTGDMLFVDRVTYNFRKPEIGEAIVFMTKYCDGMTRMNGGIPDDKYYIKRLVGKEGDELKVERGTLLRNGKPISGSVAFDKNAKSEGKYKGYKNEGCFEYGDSVRVSPKKFFAMGDNSSNSLDSRYWGEVPEKAVVGKSVIITYPFTSRWGASK